MCHIINVLLRKLEAVKCAPIQGSNINSTPIKTALKCCMFLKHQNFVSKLTRKFVQCNHHTDRRTSEIENTFNWTGNIGHTVNSVYPGCVRSIENIALNAYEFLSKITCNESAAAEGPHAIIS